MPSRSLHGSNRYFAKLAAAGFAAIVFAAAGAPALSDDIEPNAVGGFTGAPSDDPSARVVGGHPASHAKWPSLVYVDFLDRGKKESFSCGGTVVAPDWVMTAGHCALGRKAEGFVVVEDADDLSNAEALVSQGKVIHVAEVIVHPAYRKGSGHEPHNDIALFRLSEPAHVTPQVLISKAAVGTLLHEGMSTSLAGYGLTTAQTPGKKRKGEPSTSLLETDVPFVERASCNRILERKLGHAFQGVVDAAAICAGDTRGKHDSCSGDSGGPLTADMGDGHRAQIGIVSWGPGCAQRNSVGVYTSVGYFEPWIRAHVPDASFYAKPAAVAAATPAAKPPAPPQVAPVPALKPVAAPPAAAAPAATPAAAPPPAQPTTETMQPVAVASIEAVAGVLGPAGQRLKVDLREGKTEHVGDLVHVRIDSAMAGQLLVYNVDLTSGRAYQIYPNQISNRGAPIGAGLKVEAGTAFTVPKAGDPFRFRIRAPVGPNRLYAFVLPSTLKLEDIAAKGQNMRDLPDAPATFDDLAARAIRDIGIERVDEMSAAHGAATYNYEILP